MQKLSSLGTIQGAVEDSSNKTAAEKTCHLSKLLTALNLHVRKFGTFLYHSTFYRSATDLRGEGEESEGAI